MTTSIARRFAAFASACPDIPAQVIHAADRAMLDTMGAIIAGGAHPSTQAVAGAMPQHDGLAILATGGQTDAETAAAINGMAAHVWDIDDTSYTGIMHGSAVILPALLALGAEVQADADTLRRAFIVGSEITYVLADICTHGHYFHGWWSTVTFSLTGATAAAGVLLNLTEDQMVAAIGLAAAASGGGKAVFGTDGKPFLVGDAARRAISFARVAKAGLGGPERVFEDDRGYLKLLNGGTADMAALDTLALQWRLVDPGLLFKTNPVCSAAHAAIDAMNALMTELSTTPDQIADINADVPELVFISLVYPDPQTPQQAQFSLPFAVACAALHGRVRFEDLLPEAVRSADKIDLMGKTRTESVAELSTDEMRDLFPESARLTVTLKDGRQASRFCGLSRGMPGNPQSDADLIAKFETAAAYAGHGGFVTPRIGDNPIATFAQIMT
ncbi:MmgE/PrpD family protein [Ruegeria sp. Ofav3-42]|uniref:MmgE/PrpD family protein n=1 Tax=Ruegeria sp. Ofav3-42 TaxID=2917759 RepID=UPI001EF6B362|nr:MmgE/PrpD family protein [Ruegeria sp. Ofav3-42]MCG7522531.1 MmgE/PrpD family protein [Ruegeria sp. Ofav3-42]